MKWSRHPDFRIGGIETFAEVAKLAFAVVLPFTSEYNFWENAASGFTSTESPARRMLARGPTTSVRPFEAINFRNLDFESPNPIAYF
jgi:hypothetical protein